VLVEFDGREIAYGFGEAGRAGPRLATTIHKAQGSEYPAVVIPLTTQHYPMLRRNLVYTGVTRGTRLVVIVGQGLLESRSEAVSRSGAGPSSRSGLPARSSGTRGPQSETTKQRPEVLLFSLYFAKCLLLLYYSDSMLFWQAVNSLEPSFRSPATASAPCRCPPPSVSTRSRGCWRSATCACAVARAITGTQWSGPLFFGMRKTESGSS
jgi:UvrD-like helicase C-terminal domain